MRQIYTALAILLPILMLMGVSILSITALQTHPHDDPLPPRPGSQPAGGGDEGPPTPKINPLDGDPIPPVPN